MASRRFQVALTVQRITASTTAVALNPGGTAGGRLYVTNTSANAADLGPSTVTAGTGYPLAANASASFQLGAGEQLYAIRTGAADATLAVLRTGL
jgi:hypothetical protein